MFKNKIMIALAASLLSTAAFAEDPAHAAHPHWSYDGAEGPDHWADIEPEFSTCSAGKNQSPVNLTSFIKAELAPIKFDYKAGGEQIHNNGHTIQVNFAEGSSMTLNEHVFALKQFHVHSPSENQINGKSFPMEAHFVHADAKGRLVVVAVMFEEGKANAELEKAWKVMPHEAGEKVTLTEHILGTAVMPDDKAYYRFNGSLTTPPCTEGVTWLVLKNPVTASKKQIENFTHVMQHHNNRPVQPTNAREILE
jgi:carbonic anhydrase